ncbi:RagB/SusD family nutrient uptake outer membrane protein [Parapedobacter sp. 10938]|uniref:RagB/SusD family nutrient uptake outer membrane protein n=1 Tax=Parapedobacter flavus TaxID=3110225 RepID=UPI002DBA8800|nr:RagB/SusD family nutrient uptake outer membrane protein [Parapedobacter sp. 10938]MEC3881657.1 RagB/SusD family nutrient uptake outer membrane protein [Parapedobacter sp. 10938]
MRYLNIFFSILGLTALNACNDYLNVVPDGVATIENAFTSRTTAEKYLFTCYSYMPSHGSYDDNPAYFAGDEFWTIYPQSEPFFWSSTFEEIARENQGVVSPRLNYWDGSNGGRPLFQALRDCNIFLENIEAVPGMQERERLQWIAEVKFLKAYYHFWLLRMYGPIPLIKENLPISAGVEEVQVARVPVDACFAYIVELLDEAAPDLPPVVSNENDELGRITQVIAKSVKAAVLVEAASPLFNGNTDYTTFTNKDGEPLFNTTYDAEKWRVAAEACVEAIELCHSVNLRLYTFNPASLSTRVSDTTTIKMSIRNSVAQRWNSEIIWGNASSLSNQMQTLSQARVDPDKPNNAGARSLLAVTMKVAETFYTENGVPIDEDVTWDYANRYTLKNATSDDRYNIGEGYETASVNFNRENRYYASLGFDGGVWFGQGNYDDNDPWVLRAKSRQVGGKLSASLYSVTGYWPKKLVHFQNTLQEGDGGGYSVVSYPWPVMRLADLYLLYAEALNEYAGPSDEAYHWIDLVRERAGLPGVQEAWSTYSRQNNKYADKDGLREIIQQERLIELAFEGHRFWDIRRWKRGREMFAGNIQGWDIEQEEATLYYRVKTLFTKSFGVRDYLWPLSEGSLIVNKNLVQNPGW